MLAMILKDVMPTSRQLKKEASCDHFEITVPRLSIGNPASSARTTKLTLNPKEK